MKDPKPLVEAVLDTRRMNTRGDNYPVKLRITFQRLRKYYRIGVAMTQAEWERAQGKRLPAELAAKMEAVNAAKLRAIGALAKLESFSFAAFEDAYFVKHEPAKKKVSLPDVFGEVITSLTAQGRIGTADSYAQAFRAFQRFDPRFGFQSLTPAWLERFEQWMLAQGRSMATIGIYGRSLRTIVNVAIERKLFERDKYPFGRRRYVIPKGPNPKKALEPDDLRKLWEYAPEPGSREEYFRDIWFFSYFCNGMNMADVAGLRPSDFSGGGFSFHRAKTGRTAKASPQPVTVPITTHTQAILDRHGDMSGHYVFPVLRPGMTPIQRRSAIKHFTKLVNEYIGGIAAKVGVAGKVTTYTARHTFSTKLLRAGAPIEFLREALGHASPMTTLNYLKGFDDSTKRRFAEKLADFGE